MHASFTNYLLQANHLQQQGFRAWAFRPGMLFAASHTWWGAGEPRPRAHEGLDLCAFTNCQGELNALAAGTLIPALFAGQVVAIFADFLGQSILVAHQQQGESRFHAIYAHVIAEPHLAIGRSCHEGEIIARLATSRKPAIPAHLHLSTLWLTGAPVDDLSWPRIHSSSDIHLCDPLPFILDGEHFVEKCLP